MFKIDDFRTHFSKHNEFARPSKFEARFNAPEVAKIVGGQFVQNLRFHCEAAELPGYNINTVDNRIYGVPDPVASTASFGDITLTFICAGDMIEKKYFDYWMDSIIPVNSYNVSYKNTYATNIDIIQYTDFDKDIFAGKELSIDPHIPDLTIGGGSTKFTLFHPGKLTLSQPPSRSKQEVYAVTLFEAFPVSMAPISLNWAEDGISKLAVTFKYERWTQTSKSQFPQFGPSQDALPGMCARSDGSSVQQSVLDRIAGGVKGAVKDTVSSLRINRS